MKPRGAISCLGGRGIRLFALALLQSCSALINIAAPSTNTDSNFGEIAAIPDLTLITSSEEQPLDWLIEFAIADDSNEEAVIFSVATSNPSLFASSDSLVIMLDETRSGRATLRYRIAADAVGQSVVTIILKLGPHLIERSFSLTVLPMSAVDSLQILGAPFVFTRSNLITPVPVTALNGLPVTFVECASAPALPSGLSFTLNGSGQCTLAGTPTAVRAARDYLLTAITANGQRETVAPMITVVDIIPSGLAFSASPVTFTVGSTITPLVSTHGGGALTNCSLDNASAALPPGLTLTLAGGECTISGTPNAVRARALYTIVATNSGGSTSANVDIQVHDEAPTSIAFPAPTVQLPRTLAMSPISTTSGGGGAIAACTLVSGILPPGLSLSLVGGQCRLSGTPTTLQAAADIVVRATNTGGYAEATLSIEVVAAPPSALSFGTTSVTLTRSSAMAALTSTHVGDPIDACDVVSNALPAGVTLAVVGGECVISGTPTLVQTSVTVGVRATNGGGTTTQSISLAVNDVAPTALAFAPASVAFTRTTSIGSVASTHTGGPLVSCALVTPASLPAGLSLGVAAGNCVLSGTPTALSVAALYTIRGTNSGGSSDTSLTIAVNDVAPTVLAYSGTSYTLTKDQAITPLDSTHSGGPLTGCAISAGTLPTGLSVALVANSCRITGTPTLVQGATGATVRGTNSGGTIDRALSFTVNDVSPTGVAFTGSPFTFTRTTSIGTISSTAGTGGAITSCAAAGGTPLPAGLSASASGGLCTLTGTPTVIATAADYTIELTNSGGPGSLVINIAVRDVAPSGLNMSGSPYTFVIDNAITPANTTHAGGPVTVCSGSLPNGLSWSVVAGECQLSGTPVAVVASQLYTLTAQNSGGSTTLGVTIAVNDVAPSVLGFSGAPFTFTKDSAITPQSSTHTGGAITTCTGSLPAGLAWTVASGECRLSGTPTAVTTSAAYTLTYGNSGGSTTANVTIAVNDIAPSALAFAAAPFTFTRNSAITAQNSTHAGGVLTACTALTTLPAGLSLSLVGNSCRLSGTPTVVVVPAQLYDVRATNSGGSTDLSVSIRVNDVAPSSVAFAGSPFVYTRGVAISSLTSTHAGGSIVSCAVTGSPSSLPSGLGVAASGGECVISGTPTAIAATNTYTIAATNSGGSSNATAISITVADAAPAGVTFSGTPFTFTRGVDIGLEVSGSGSGGAITSCSAPGGLPAGLSAAFSTGVCTLSGTPTSIVNPATSHTIRASNSGGNFDFNVTIGVNDVAPSNLSFPSSSYTYDVTGSAITPRSTNHDGGAITGCALSGTPATLPAGLSLGVTSGECVLSGTPTTAAATDTYTIRATNSGGFTTTTLSLTVRSAPTLSYGASSGTSVVVNAAMSVAPSTLAANGAAISSCGIKSGSPNAAAFPATLTVNATTCVISGTPNAELAATAFTLVATNAVGTSSDAIVTLTVTSGGAGIVSSGLNFHLDAAYANGGTGPYTPTSDCGDTSGTWVNRFGSGLNATLVEGSPCRGEGWRGDGTTTPYRLHYEGDDGEGAGLGLTAALSTSVNFSFETWVYRPTGAYGQLCLGENCIGPGYMMVSDGAHIDVGGTPKFCVSGFDYGIPYPSYACATAAGAVATGTWVHLVGTHDGSRVRFYINGVLAGDVPYNQHLTAIGGFSFGRGDSGTPLADLAVVRHYTRALSPREIVQNCAADEARFGVECGIESQSLVANFDAAVANGSTGPYPPTSDCASNLRWTDALNAYYVDLNWPAGCNGEGWRGAGVVGDPYRLSLLGDDGTGDYGVSFLANLPANPNFSLDIWAYRPAGTDSVLICSAGDDCLSGSATTGARLTLAPFPNLCLYGTASICMTSTVNIPDNTWAHLAVTYNGSTAALFVNGALAGSEAYAAYQSYTGLRIGDLASHVPRIYDVGAIRVYSTGLSAADVKRNCRSFSYLYGVTCAP